MICSFRGFPPPFFPAGLVLGAIVFASPGALFEKIVPPESATAQAKKNLVKFTLVGGTIPHEVTAKFGAGKVWMKPAASGTGVIAGGGVRAVLEAAGVKNVLTKSLGSSNAFNMVGATFEALKLLRTKEDIFKLRGK